MRGDIWYRATVRPLDIQTSSSTTGIVLRATLIWIVSLVLATPEAIFSDLHVFNVPSSNKSFVTCAPYPPRGRVQKTLGQDSVGICGPLRRMLAAQSRHLLIPLLPLLRGGHVPDPLCVQRCCSDPGLHKLLPEPFCSLSAQQELSEGVQGEPLLFLP
ncbi:uncharacterized protein grpr isoform X2 [Phyllopteryx taeniolatus]|uniref:uncharacterized protein grpr isoform X2 n=1 Tax=Phyllopteryx taeniolatus TaxID=161469 RepID=UPI002AD35074|nr:uncharacterized protein grpr isoform X2 [Phyllopteryx taeniolatus]